MEGIPASQDSVPEIQSFTGCLLSLLTCSVFKVSLLQGAFLIFPAWVASLSQVINAFHSQSCSTLYGHEPCLPLTHECPEEENEQILSICCVLGLDLGTFYQFCSTECRAPASADN